MLRYRVRRVSKEDNQSEPQPEATVFPSSGEFSMYFPYCSCPKPGKFCTLHRNCTKFREKKLKFSLIDCNDCADSKDNTEKMAYVA